MKKITRFFASFDDEDYDEDTSSHHSSNKGSSSRNTGRNASTHHKKPTHDTEDVTKEYGKKIEDLLSKSMLPSTKLKFKVTKVRQIYSRHYQTYIAHLKSIEAENPPKLGFDLDTNAAWQSGILKGAKANEVFLFQGTKPELSDVIIKHGFDPREPDLRGLLKDGIHFAENPEKSFFYPHYQSSRQIFLSRVILGNAYKTMQNFKLSKAPVINEENSSKTYDSVITVSTRKEGHREFTVYDKDHCLPMFLIDYKI